MKDSIRKFGRIGWIINSEWPIYCVKYKLTEFDKNYDIHQWRTPEVAFSIQRIHLLQFLPLLPCGVNQNFKNNFAPGWRDEKRRFWICLWFSFASNLVLKKIKVQIHGGNQIFSLHHASDKRTISFFLNFIDSTFAVEEVIWHSLSEEAKVNSND